MSADAYLPDGTPLYIKLSRHSDLEAAFIQAMLYQELLEYHPFTEFRQITEHYGIQRETQCNTDIWVIYRGTMGTKGQLVTARFDMARAVHECIYLERLNAPRWKKERKNDSHNI